MVISQLEQLVPFVEGQHLSKSRNHSLHAQCSQSHQHRSQAQMTPKEGKKKPNQQWKKIKTKKTKSKGHPTFGPVVLKCVYSKYLMLFVHQWMLTCWDKV